MESYVVWFIVGLVLVVVELMTGSFYLLVLGVAALSGALAAFLGADFSLQAIVASIVSVAGVFLLNHWRKGQKDSEPGSNNMDLGQPVSFESWIDEAARLARVKYRGASWDAHVMDNAPIQANGVLYISGAEGAQLQVSAVKPNVKKEKL